MRTRAGIASKSCSSTPRRAHSSLSGSAIRIRTSVLLQLLVLKQISASSKITVAQASQSLGMSLGALKKNRRDGG
jgi:hypothetical protein